MDNKSLNHACNEDLLQLLHRWLWLWNEGELTLDPLQIEQGDFDELVVKTRAALHEPQASEVNDAS